MIQLIIDMETLNALIATIHFIRTWKIKNERIITQCITTRLRYASRFQIKLSILSSRIIYLTLRDN